MHILVSNSYPNEEHHMTISKS